MVLDRVWWPLFDQRCVGCREERPDAALGLCPRCLQRLRPPVPIPSIAGLRSCEAIFDYDGVGRGVVQAIKFHNRRTPIAELGRALAASLPPGAAVVTWAPTTDVRRRARGFDQAQVVAAAVARAAGLAAVPSLVRYPGSPQTGRTRAGRRQGPVFGLASTARKLGALSEHASIVLVDDVVTTGSTLRNAAQTLRPSTAASVHGRVVAYTARS